MTTDVPLRVLVLGAGGMLGTDIRREAPASVSLLEPPGGRLDLRDADAIDRVIGALCPEVVINCAAYTDVDGAERDPDAARAVNALGPGALGASCARYGARVVHFSTDYVFAGDAGRPYTEDDVPRPLGQYGRTKLDGERRLADSGAASLIVRTQWLFGQDGRSFPGTMWQRACAGTRTRVVDDQRGCPTHAPALARVTWALVARKASGLVHASGGGDASWYELASEIFRQAGAPGLLSPCRTADYPTLAPRPADSRLACDRLVALIGAPLPPWRPAITAFLAERRARDARR